MKTQVFGKSIIAGEHAVLRGCPALVFPVMARSLELEFSERETSAVTSEFGGAHGAELSRLFQGVMERGLQMTGHSDSQARGHFKIVSSIPVGAGLGASAAVCVAVGRWFAWKGWVTDGELAEFCRQLENLFHGESSGVDIAVALSSQGLHFERGGSRYPVSVSWKPRWFISYSGKRGITAECVNKVKALWAADESLGLAIDARMKAAVELAEASLTAESSENSFAQLASAIAEAGECFRQWGLAGAELGAHLKMLKENGARAVKPTGSGDGGFALSLWEQAPPESLATELTAL
jgi:mevalonate kinase